MRRFCAIISVKEDIQVRTEKDWKKMLDIYIEFIYHIR